MFNTETIGDRIATLRKRRAWNQDQLADKLDVSKQTISNWETGNKSPRMGKVEELAELFNVSKSFIIDGQDSDIEINVPVTSTYNYFDTGLSAGILTQVDPFTASNVEKIALSDVVMGKYAGDKDIFISHVNGESMNRIIPDKSLIAIKKARYFSEFKNGDIVVFRDGGDMSVKRFYNNEKSKTISFTPDSTDKEYEPIVYRYEDVDELEIVGRVVVYTVEL